LHFRQSQQPLADLDLTMRVALFATFLDALFAAPLDALLAASIRPSSSCRNFMRAS